MIRIALAESQPLMRLGIRESILAEPDFRLVADTADPHDLLDVLLEDEIDLVVLDPTLDRVLGADLTLVIRCQHPGRPILALADCGDGVLLARLLENGVNGYVCRNAEGAELCRAIRAAWRGERLARSGSSFVR